MAALLYAANKNEQLLTALAGYQQLGANDTNANIVYQLYITQFAATGSPNAPKLPYFPPSTGGLAVQNLGSDFIGPMQDESGVKELPERCRYWQQAPYFSGEDENNRSHLLRGGGKGGIPGWFRVDHSQKPF